MTNNSDDPFERVAQGVAKDGAAKPAATSARKAEDGEHVSPAPADAPPLPAEWKGLGAPVAYVYRDAGGRVLRATLRFQKADGEKDIRPATLWRTRPGRPPSWRFKAEPGPRPLYGLDRLAARPAAAVLIVEGEKTADAAGSAGRFPEFVAMIWPGGANAVAKADFGPLSGRHVIVWPDADEPGRKAALAVHRAAIAAGAASAAVVQLPAFLPAGWDLADNFPAGFNRADAAAAIDVARFKAAPGGVEWPPDIRLDPKDGLFYDERKDHGVIPHWLSDPFEVLGEARTRSGDGWSVVIRFKDRDQVERTVPIARSALAGGGGDARVALAHAGLVFHTGRGKTDKLTLALMRVKCTARVTLTNATGWMGEVFVLPGRTIGPAGAERVLLTVDAPSLGFGASGEFDAWRAEVAARATCAASAIFSLSAAFAAPMLNLTGAEGGGFNWRGNSSFGKSTLLVMAGSVWGGGRGELGYVNSWRATANALESLALSHNDLLLCLDELKEIDPAEAGVAAYSLANGQGKARLRADGSMRPQASWKLLVLSSGEMSLAEHMASNPKGGKLAVGAELRMVDLPADGRAGLGIWEGLDTAEALELSTEAERVAAAERFSLTIKAAAKAHYGHAGPLFLERLTADRESAVARAEAVAAAFLPNAEVMGDSGQVRRVARRFGIVAAAGELAIGWGILPWEPGTAYKAALDLYRRWADAFGRDTSREDMNMLRQLQRVLQSEGDSGFAAAGDDDGAEDQEHPSASSRTGEARQMRTYGRKKVIGRELYYLIHSDGWARVFAEFDKTAAARVVYERGFLLPGTEQGRMQKTLKRNGVVERYYFVKAAILADGFGD